MCGMPCAVRRIVALLANALAGTTSASSAAPTPIARLRITPGKAKGCGRDARRSLAQLEVLAPVHAAAVEHRQDTLPRRRLVEVVERERHVARRLRLRAHS